MAIDWDWILAVIIILALILTIWAKISKQTVMELIKSMVEYVKEKREGQD